MDRVGSFPHPSQAIQGGYSCRGGEVAIAPASTQALLEVHTQLCRQPARPLEELGDLGRPHHRGAVHPALHPQLHIGRFRLQPGDSFFHPLALLGSHHPEVNLRIGLGSHHIGASTAPGQAHIHGGAGVGVVQAVQPYHLMGKFEDGTSSLLRGNARVGGAPLHPHPETSHSFAGRLERTIRRDGRLQDIDHLASLGLREDGPAGGEALYLLIGIEKKDKGNGGHPPQFP